MDNKRHMPWEAIFENAVDAIITMNEVGLMEAINPATERLFGYSADELIGRNFKTLMPSPYRDTSDGYWKHYLESRIPKITGKGRRVTGVRKDGSTFPIHLAISEVRAEQRTLFTGIARDISDLVSPQSETRQLNEDLQERLRERTEELQLAQAELRHQEKLAILGQVSGGIAHEIRNPLNAVKTSVFYLLNAEDLSEAKIKEHLDRIDRQVTLIENVVTAFSDVARLPAPTHCKQDLSSHIQAVLRTVALPEWIEVVTRFPDEPVEVAVDGNQIPIVFRNLVRNARDAMQDGGTLTIGVGKNAEGNTIAFVSDTGTGISDEDLDRVMEPLYSTKAGGMGLGLAISRAIVERNGARLAFESEFGKGSTFYVIFAES
jgi:two-component system sensor kinase FixL